MKKPSESQKMPDFEAGLYDSGRKTADMAVMAVGNNAAHFALLVEMSFSKPYPLCMRAARVVQLCCEKNISFILPYLDEVIIKISTSRVEGVKRNYLKIIDEFVDFGLVKDNALLLQTCFDWLVNPSETLGIRYYCIGIIEKFCRYEPELLGEFLNSLEFCLDESSAGFRNRAIKVLRKHNKSL